MTKPCRYCYTEVHRSARVCPSCHNAQTTLGITKSLLMTIFPILTTVGSLGIAYYEKLEKDAAVVLLEREKLSATAAIELADDLSESLSDNQLAETYVSTFGRLPTRERLEDVERIAKEQKQAKTLSHQELKNLSKERKELRLMFKRSSSNKRKNFRNRKNKNDSTGVASRSRSDANRSSRRSAVIPAGGIAVDQSRSPNFLPSATTNISPGNVNLPTIGNRTLVPSGTLNFSNGQEKPSSEPAQVVVDGKRVTPLLNVSKQLLQDVQKVR